jgi:YD repeat-containing protein
LREACRQLPSNLLGRRTQDRVVTLGSGVDGAVRRIVTAYNKQGEVERITSFDSASSGNVVNEVVVIYNGFGQAIDTFQSHTGAVNLSTTPSVQMAYADGSANTIRPTGITDPDGRKITFDYYGYDGLHRLHWAERGDLNSGHTSITSPQFGQCWKLDPIGNWHGFRQDDDGSSTWDLIQARTSNPVNEITDSDNTTGPSWVTPTYDANGNMTLIPRPDLGTDRAMTATWDAWNRLVKLVDPDTSDTLAEFAYDGRNFRIVGKSFDGGTLEETRHYYFTDSWQCLEERIDTSSDPERQHVWGIRYIDDLVLRDRDTTGNGTLDERLYFLPDIATCN